MGYKIVNKLILAEGVKRVDVHAPRIANKVRPGQFVNVCPEEGDERVPLTVVDADKNKQTISLIFQETGPSTKKAGGMSINEEIFSILGPLGMPATIEKKGEVVCIATGIGTAQILPIARALGEAGNKVIGIVGAKTKRKLMLEPQIRIACNKIFIATEDGSYERKALATDILGDLIMSRRIKLVYAIGSPEMMQAVCRTTRKKNIKTRVQLNPMMVDCMGMCGSCRVKVGNRQRLACIDGPEFNGHMVDFNDYMIRMNAYEKLEQWDNHKSQPVNQRNGSGVFRRFLAGILSE